jgi:rRNA-processing protein FCF1
VEETDAVTEGPANWDTINELIAATAEAREVIREMHGAQKDLRREIAEARAFIASDIEAAIRAEVAKQMAELGEATSKAMRESVAKVGREFDRLEAIFTGRDKTARKAGHPPLEDLIRRVADS